MASVGPDNPDERGVLVTGEGKKRVAVGIGVVLFEGFSLLSAGLVSEVFQIANEISAAKLKGNALYEVRLYSGMGGRVVLAADSAGHVRARQVNSSNMRSPLRRLRTSRG